MKSIKFEKSYTATAATKALDELVEISGLSKAKLKDAMAKGAVWLHQGKKSKRLRRAQTTLKTGETISLHYDSELLSRSALEPVLLKDESHYSVWYKPAGTLSQGTLFGDHCSLLRQAEQFFACKRPALLVHRLDRETDGIMLIAHSKKAAAALSNLFQSRSVIKRYRAQVRGEIPEALEICAPIDGKVASTKIKRLNYDPENNASDVEVLIETGRKHQIRRHLAEVGFPVLGDPAYGNHNSDSRGLQLTASEISFICPLRKQSRHYIKPADLALP